MTHKDATAADQVIVNAEEPCDSQNMETIEIDVDVDSHPASPRSGCCAWRHFEGDIEAKGVGLLSIPRGFVLTANIFLGTALLHLATEEAGCVDENGRRFDKCENRIYGIAPVALLNYIGLVVGLLSALVMPVVGAMIDYTPHRRLIGIISALVITLVQIAQIGTFKTTWFPMSILQAVAGFAFQIQILATYSYYPEIARNVGERIMSKFSSHFIMIENVFQLIHLLVVTLLSMVLKLDDPATGRLSQAIASVAIVIGYIWGWNIIPSVPNRDKLQEGHSLLLEGFRKNYRTAISINKHYKSGLRWFLMATTFTEASAFGFANVSITFLVEKLNLSGKQIGLVFMLSLIFSLPGSLLIEWFTKRTNPKIGLMSVCFWMMIATFAGAMVLTRERIVLIYLFAGIWGMGLGGYFPASGLFFSLCLPKGQESELTGFFIYSGLILSWLPSSVFTALVEAGIDQKWGLASLVIYYGLAILLLYMSASWEDILKERDQNIGTDVVYHGDEVDKPTFVGADHNNDNIDTVAEDTITADKSSQEGSIEKV